MSFSDFIIDSGEMLIACGPVQNDRGSAGIGRFSDHCVQDVFSSVTSP